MSTPSSSNSECVLHVRGRRRACGPGVSSSRFYRGTFSGVMRICHQSMWKAYSCWRHTRGTTDSRIFSGESLEGIPCRSYRVDDLLAVAQTKNFSRAADLRCVTQSALSRRIRSLEDWAGVELVDRSTYPVQLTAAGQTFCDQGREALAALIELRTSLR